MAGFDDEETEDPDFDEDGDGADDADEVEDAEDSEALEGGFKETLAEDDIEAFDGEDVDEDLKAVDEALNHKDQNARTLAIRRALEERAESRRISQDLDYLDLDIDD